MVEVIDCEEFGEIELGIDRLLVDGEIALDSRIVDKGYLSLSLVKGQVVLRADRYVGLIPINGQVAIRVKPRANVANIAHMIVKSGVAPFAIPDFFRGYLPNFETGENVERIYASSLVGGLERVAARGLMKTYVSVSNPPPWRGRFLISDTIRRHRARNIRHRGEFDYRTLAYSGIENVALKRAGVSLRDWLTINDNKSALLPRLDAAQKHFEPVPAFHGAIASLVKELAWAVGRLPTHYGYYRDPLWTAYVILQGTVPDLEAEGFVTLESLIVDLSKVFEAYIRQLMIERAAPLGWQIVNGESVVYPFFVDGNAYRVKPDMVIVREGQPIAIIDAKYKLEPKESDRYEVLAFMDALGVTRGGFILPARAESASRYMGVTTGGKMLFDLRFDLAAGDIEAEADRFMSNVRKLVDGASDFS